ncbi:MAG: fatty acid desaturase [Planctomycetota bacterium]
MQRQLTPKALALISNLREIRTSAPLSEIKDVVSDSEIGLADVAQFATYSDDTYTRNTVFRSERFEVKLLVWSAGQASPVHDHRGSTCVVKVLSGVASETTFQFDESGTPAATGFRRHQAGSVFGEEDTDVHQLANLDRETLYTLHVYSPPLTDMSVWDDLPSQRRPSEPALHHRLDDDALRRAYATSDFPLDAEGRYRPDWLTLTIDPDSAIQMSKGRSPDIRDQVSRRLERVGWMGRMADRFVTLVSGIAPHGVEPWFIWRRPMLYAAVMLWLLGGAAASMAIVASGSLWLLLLLTVSLPMTAAGARAGMLTTMHDAIHMWAEHPNERVRTLFYWIGSAMGWFLLVEDFPTYASKHIIHHGDDFATPNDPDVRLIRGFGFEPGMSADKLRQHFRKMRWSPRFHWKYFSARLASQFGRGPLARRVGVGGFWLGVLGTVVATGFLLPFLIGWVLPVVFMFQRNALEQFMGEHRWLKQADAGTERGVFYAQTSAGRFALDAPPAEDMPRFRRGIAWLAWTLKLLTEHALYRSSVVWGDLSNHDEHHVHGLAMLHERGTELPRYALPDVAWMNTAYGRRVYENLRAPNDPELQQFWNRWQPLDATFQSLSELDPNEVGAPTDGDETANGMLGM